MGLAQTFLEIAARYVPRTIVCECGEPATRIDNIRIEGTLYLQYYCVACDSVTRMQAEE